MPEKFQSTKDSITGHEKNGKTSNLHFEIQIGTFGLCWLILNDLPRSVANFINRKILVFTIISTKCKNDHANDIFIHPLLPLKRKGMQPMSTLNTG